MNIESPNAALIAATPPLTESLHDAAIATADVNNWPHAYALGYVSGLEDCQRRRDPEHDPRERDDFARGYVRGYSVGIMFAVHCEKEEA